MTGIDMLYDAMNGDATYGDMDAATDDRGVDAPILYDAANELKMARAAIARLIEALQTVDDMFPPPELASSRERVLSRSQQKMVDDAIAEGKLFARTGPAVASLVDQLIDAAKCAYTMMAGPGDLSDYELRELEADAMCKLRAVLKRVAMPTKEASHEKK